MDVRTTMPDGQKSAVRAVGEAKAPAEPRVGGRWDRGVDRRRASLLQHVAVRTLPDVNLDGAEDDHGNGRPLYLAEATVQAYSGEAFAVGVVGNAVHVPLDRQACDLFAPREVP